MFLSLLLAFGFVLLLWWSLTGIVLYLDGLPARTFPKTLLVATVLVVLALLGLLGTRGSTETAAVYCAFTCGMLIWGYIELTYLTGYVTGPVKYPCPPEVRGWRRFMLALGTSLYHELLIVLTGAALFVLTAEAPNRFALWCFVVLWAMRWSTKLNAFFGVRNLNEDWLPGHLAYLVSYMRKRPVNPFFPFSVIAAVIVAASLGNQMPALSGHEKVGMVLVLSLLLLGILEHFLLVLPLDASRPWRWGFRSHERTGSSRRETR